MVIIVPIEVSARHLHLTEADFKILFGPKQAIIKKKTLSMANYFVTEEKVEIIGPRDSFTASFIGPFREYSQVEMSLSEARTIGLDPHLAVSGNLDKALAIKLKGSVGEVNLERGVILPHRHLHANFDEAKTYGLKDGQMVKVQINGGRAAILDQVVVRLAADFSLRVHLDIDEGNAVGLPGGGQGELII